MLPSLFKLVTMLAGEYGVPYVRAVRDRGGRFGFRKAVFARLSKSDRTTIGVVDSGQLTADRIIDLLDHIADTTELVTHPGDNVRGYAHWRYDWEGETAALCNPHVREAIAARGIKLVPPSHI